MRRKHEFDQHFFRSPRLVAELVGHTSIKKRDVVYDLGAGSGVITSVLARRVQHVVAVEKDSETLAILRKNMKSYANVKILSCDLLTVPFPSADSYKIFANPPFSLSAQVISLIAAQSNPPQAAYFIVQKQFARKLLANHEGFTSQLGMSLAPWWDVKIRKPLKRTDFWPHPHVDTVLIELKPRENALLEPAYKTTFEKFIKDTYEKPAYFKKIASVNTVPASRYTIEKYVALFLGVINSKDS